MLHVLAILVFCIATWASALNDPSSGKRKEKGKRNPISQKPATIPACLHRNAPHRNASHRTALQRTATHSHVARDAASFVASR